MSSPKLHRYVPRFYLNKFTDSNKQFWIWNKDSESVFKGSPYGVAAENHFYRIPEFVGTETDPLFLEHNLAHLEGKVATILQHWFERLGKFDPMEELDIDEETRHTISYFIAVQFFRTVEQRDILTLFAETKGGYAEPITPEEKINLHAYFLCTSELVFDVASRIEKSIWMFGRNNSDVPFWTSDNPVCFKTGDNKMWLKGPGIMSEGTYVVYPLSPRYVLYCKEPTYWDAIRIMNNKLSPVEFDSDMVEHENAGQVFSARRFVISSEDEFAFAREFVKTIGTNIYAPDTANN